MISAYLNEINETTRSTTSDYSPDKEKIENVRRGIRLLDQFDSKAAGLPAYESRLAIYRAQKLAEKILVNRYYCIKSEDEIVMLNSILPDPFALGHMISDGLSIKSNSLDLMRCNKALALGGMIRPNNIRSMNNVHLMNNRPRSSDRVFALLNNYLDYGEESMRAQSELMINHQVALIDLIIPYLKEQAKRDPEATVRYISDQPLFDSLPLYTDYHDQFIDLDTRSKLFIKLITESNDPAIIESVMKVDPDRFCKISTNDYMRNSLEALVLKGHVNIAKMHPEAFFDAAKIREMFIEIMSRGQLDNRQYRRFSQAYKSLGGTHLIRDIEAKPPEEYLEIVKQFDAFREGLKHCHGYDDFYEAGKSIITPGAKSMIELNTLRYKSVMQDEDLNDRFHSLYITHTVSQGKAGILEDINGPISAKIWLEAATEGDLTGTDYKKTKLTPSLHEVLKKIDFDTYETILQKNGDIPCFRRVRWVDKAIRRQAISQDFGI